MPASFSFPTKILSGPGSLAELPPYLMAQGVQRPLLVTDAGLLSTPALAAVKNHLPPGTPIFSEVHSNPQAADVTAGAEALRSQQCDAVVAVGGGSALDVGKLLGAAVALGEEQWPGLNWQMEVPKKVPFIAIPTTAGTGSEVGRSSVITFEGTKRVLFHPALLAGLVILEPALTAGLPPRLTAATGVDALTHCIEAHTSTVSHPLCEAIALEGARIIFNDLPAAVEHGNDLGAREQMQIAALMGGIAFQKELGAAHSLSHPLSAKYGMHHGLANGLCLLPVMRWNQKHKPGVYHRLAEATGTGRTDAQFISAVESLLQRVGISGGLRAQGVQEADLPELAAAAAKDGCHATNPVPVTEQDLLQLYREAL